MKYVTLSTDPSSYGSGMDGCATAELNKVIRAAAQQAGIVVLEGDPLEIYAVTETVYEEGWTAIDWFSVWCAEGSAWSVEEWLRWFRGA